MTTATKSITKVTMIWSEGHEAENRDFATLSDFNDFIRHEILPSHEGLGYLKTKFVITFTDGDTYTGRIDVEPDHCDLFTHILETCCYCAKQALAKGEIDKADSWIDMGALVQSVRS